MEEALNVNAPEIVSWRERVRGSEAFFLWVAFSLLLFLFSRFGPILWDLMQELLGALPTMPEHLINLANFARLTQIAAASPESRQALLELARQLARTQA